MIDKLNGLEKIKVTEIERLKQSMIVANNGIRMASILKAENEHYITIIIETFNNIICNKPN